MAFAVLAGLAVSFIFEAKRHWRRPAAYLVVAAGGSSALISALKATTKVSCPWDFSRYGGHREFISVFHEFSARTGENCFPAGHASSGYIWLCGYFLALHMGWVKRWWCLLLPLFVGLVFGVSQQLRGAHFISHDLWTLAICWFFSLCCYQLMLRHK